MIGLGVNIDHVATIRQARQTVEPDPAWAAAEAQLGGAEGITFHLRKDRRHIQDGDLPHLRSASKCKLNMEMSLDEEIVAIAIDLAPDQATVVPENRQEITTEGGLDVAGQIDRVREVTQRLKDRGVIVSAFIDADAAQIDAAHQAGCDAVEFHTGEYANAWLAGGRSAQPAALSKLQHIVAGLTHARELGLVCHAGHGLTYDNIGPIAAIEGFTEFNIGHSIVSRAVFVGLREAVTEMKRLIRGATGR
jgi:pyridoxine 5-phosphate synthase